jgi:PknH-like extracellular domain
LPILAATTLTLASCAQTTAGSADYDAANAAKPLDAGDAEQVLLRLPQLSEVVGEQLNILEQHDTPNTRTPAVPECTAIEAIGRQAFVGDDWVGLNLMLLIGGIADGRLVAQAAAIYADAPGAAAAFVKATKDIEACDGKEIIGAGDDPDWKYAGVEVTTDTVRWSKHQTDDPKMWGCYGQSRVRNNAILQAVSCQDGGATEGVTQTLVDQMSANVWDLSAP